MNIDIIIIIIIFITVLIHVYICVGVIQCCVFCLIDHGLICTLVNPTSIPSSKLCFSNI